MLPPQKGVRLRGRPVCPNRARRRNSSHARAASGHHSRTRPHTRGRTRLSSPIPSSTRRARLRHAPDNTSSFFARPAQTTQRPRKRHRRQRHALFLMPGVRHLPKRRVSVTTHKLFKLSTLQCRHNRRATGWLCEMTVLCAQGKPIVNGRAADAKCAVSAPFTQM